MEDILGFDRRIKIDIRSESHDKRVVLHNPSSDDSSRKVTKWTKPRLSIQKGQAGAKSGRLVRLTTALLISFSLAVRRKGIQNHTIATYQGIQIVRVSSILELENASDSDTVPAFDDPIDLAIRTQNVDLARRCKEEPGNLENWLNFIEYQDKIIKLGTRDRSVELSNAEQRSLAEVKMSIYKDALAKTKDDKLAQETLWLGLLYQGSKVWDGRTQQEKWDLAVQSCKSEEAFQEFSLRASQRYSISAKVFSSMFRYGKLLSIIRRLQYAP